MYIMFICAFVFNEASEKTMHGLLDNIIYYIPCYDVVYICVVTETSCVVVLPGET